MGEHNKRVEGMRYTDGTNNDHEGRRQRLKDKGIYMEN